MGRGPARVAVALSLVVAHLGVTGGEDQAAIYLSAHQTCGRQGELSSGFLWAVLGARPQTSLGLGSEGSTPALVFPALSGWLSHIVTHVTDSGELSGLPSPSPCVHGTAAPGLGVHKGHPDPTSLR